jgi:uncharacterized protein with NRDE domain
MCLILFANRSHPEYPVVIAANRDEAYARPTAPAAFWEDDPRICGGRDLEQGGTWLGVTRTGAFAAVTNFRSSIGAKNNTRSRGELVANYLRGRAGPADYVAQVHPAAGAYNGFNLLAGYLADLHFLSNRGDGCQIIEPGVHGLSNHLLNTPWPKVERGKQRLGELLHSRGDELVEALFAMLGERTVAADSRLPETGVGVVRERILSPAFIISPAYGTRSSTVLLIDRHRQVSFIERSFGEGGVQIGTATVTFQLESALSPAAA